MTTVYLIRHAEGFKNHEGIFNSLDHLQLINEKNPLSINGEELAKMIASQEEFKNLDVVWSSNYVRAMSTAKYFAYNNNLKVNIDYRLGERVYGINSWDELPSDIEERQFRDENYKIGFGESQLDVRKRMEEVFTEILNNNKDKRIAIISHATALSFLLKKWCKVSYQKPYEYHDQAFFDGIWHFCEAFKLTFDDNNLISIENLRY